MKDYTLGSVIRAGAWGMIAGGVTGFAFGLFLAPEEGQKLRRRVAYQLEHVAGQIGVFVEQISNPNGDSEARRTGDQLVEDARAKAQKIRDDIDALLGEVRSGEASRSTDTE
ncbi:MAG: YtxH domain-containing protein [Rhodothermales bacterium]